MRRGPASDAVAYVWFVGSVRPMSVTPSALRADIYRLLDRVIETGEPLEIERNGHVLVITPREPAGRLAALPRRTETIVGDPDELVRVDWSGEWRP